MRLVEGMASVAQSSCSSSSACGIGAHVCVCPLSSRQIIASTECTTDCHFFRSLGNGVRKNGVRDRCPYRRCGVDTEIPYRLFSLILCSGESVEAELVVGFGGIQTVDTEFPYRVPIVDRGTIAVPLLSGPLRLRVQSQSRTWLRIAASIAFLFRACFKGILDTIAPLSRG